MCEDIFDQGTPKYQSAMDIYDGLQEMTSGEEIGILSEMFSDVSWEGQDYYYTDNGGKLLERWEKRIEYGNKMWLMDVAVWQMSDEDANDWMYQILCNDDLAKRIGFKKIFVDTVLGGGRSRYQAVADAFEEELCELNRSDFYTNSNALAAALTRAGYGVIRNPYMELCSAVYNKLKGLRLDEEKQLVAESRALLTAYDDFLFGLKSNQYLYQRQEAAYRGRCARLQAQYEDAVRGLLAAAQAQGVCLSLPEMKALEG